MAEHSPPSVLPSPRDLPPRIRLLPGLDGTGIAYRSLREALREFDPEVVAYPSLASGYADLAARVLSRLPASQPYVLVAESYAGPLAILIASQRPMNLRGLVLCATFLRCPRPWLGRLHGLAPMLPPARLPSRLLAPLLLNGRDTQENRALIDEALAAASPRAMLARLCDVACIDVVEAARSIGVPVLYLRASGDRVVPPQSGDLVRETMPDVDLVDIEGPHLLLQTCAGPAAARIRRFVGELTAPAGGAGIAP